MNDLTAEIDPSALPWLDARLSDYRREDEVETYRLGRALVVRAGDKGQRLRLILDEATDIAHAGRDPLLPESYGVLSDEVYLRSEETIIHLKDGRRLRLFGQAEQEFL